VTLDTPSRVPSAGPSANRFDHGLECLTAFLLATGFAALAMALAGVFVAAVAPVLGALAAIGWWALLRRQDAPAAAAEETGPQPARLRAAHAAVILVLALAFRLLPYDYALGGQDQGVYTNVAAHIVHSGGLRFEDPVHAKLDGRARAIYAAENFTEPFLPGVYTDLSVVPRFTFQFYHLFPAWLAVAGGLFGLGAAGWALTLLALVSVLFLQRLAIALTGSERAGLAVGALVAANPLLAFFSKFPLTEVPTLAFSAMGFTWLARFAFAAPDARRVRWLWLSAACFASLFLTRISGFMYLPLLLVLAIAPRFLDADATRARAVTGWALATIALYLLSVGYGLASTRVYAETTYALSFGLVAGPRWPLLLAGVAFAAALATEVLLRLDPRGAAAGRLRALLPRLERLLGPLLLLVLALAAFKLYRLGFTPRHVTDPWLSQFPGVVAAGWRSLRSGSIVVAAFYAGPLLFAAYVIAAQRRWEAVGARLLLVFLFGFITYAALLNWTVPYQPYYARYLASEVVPYLLLFAGCLLAWLPAGRARAGVALGVVLSMLVALPLSLAQWGKMENAGAADSIGRLAAIADDRDLLLLEGIPSHSFQPKEVKTTLVLRFGRQVATITPGALGDYGYLRAMDAPWDDVYLVTSQAQPPFGFVRQDAVRVHASNFVRGPRPPNRVAPVLDAKLYVHRMVEPDFDPGRELRLRAGQDARVRSVVGRADADGIVADGRAGYLLFGPYLAAPPGRYRVRLEGEDAPAGAIVDVAARAGAFPLAPPTALRVGDGMLAELAFDVPEPGVGDLEVRVQVPAGARLRIAGYTIERLR
jgi:hypothetical protein